VIYLATEQGILFLLNSSLESARLGVVKVKLSPSRSASDQPAPLLSQPSSAPSHVNEPQQSTQHAGLVAQGMQAFQRHPVVTARKLRCLCLVAAPAQPSGSSDQDLPSIEVAEVPALADDDASDIFVSSDVPTASSTNRQGP
jgi:hypothetical protein